MAHVFTAAFAVHTGFTTASELATNKQGMVKALPAEAVVDYSQVCCPLELNSTVTQLTDGIGNNTEKTPVEVIDGVGQFMAEDTHLSIEWLVLEQERAVPLLAVAVDDDQIVSFFGAFEQVCPMGS